MAHAEWGLKGMVSVWRGREDEASGAREPQLSVRSYSPARPKLGEASPPSDDQEDPVRPPQPAFAPGRAGEGGRPLIDRHGTVSRYHGRLLYYISLGHPHKPLGGR